MKIATFLTTSALAFGAQIALAAPQRAPLLAPAAPTAPVPNTATTPTGAPNSNAAKGWNHSTGPATTGQPNQSCGSTTAPNTPGQAAQAPGSAFNPDGKAGTVYAGQQPQNSRNSASASQYDAACAHQK